MALIPVLTLPDPRLRAKALSVNIVNEDVIKLTNDMLETMYHEDGIGLAANQIGILQRVIVLDLGRDYHPDPLKMINPEIIWRSEDNHRVQEGCLSVPDAWGDVYRPHHIKVRYLNQNNEVTEFEAEGLLSSSIQHEIDHLDGILFVDHLSPLKKRMFMARAVKNKKRALRHHAER